MLQSCQVGATNELPRREAFPLHLQAFCWRTGKKQVNVYCLGKSSSQARRLFRCSECLQASHPKVVAAGIQQLTRRKRCELLLTINDNQLCCRSQTVTGAGIQGLTLLLSTQLIYVLLDAGHPLVIAQLSVRHKKPVIG